MNQQTRFWQGDFGDDYTLRNTINLDELYMANFGITRKDLNQELLSGIPKDIVILEAGCNQGLQLNLLRDQGYSNLWGIDINQSALSLAKTETRNNIVEGSILDIPFKDRFFDMVYTSGVLIHIHPDDIGKAMSEIYRTSKRYIWGFEYYSETYTPVPYRGHENAMWKADFPRLFLDRFPDLELLKQKQVLYQDGSGNSDVMYLLKKG